MEEWVLSDLLPEGLQVTVLQLGRNVQISFDILNVELSGGALRRPTWFACYAGLFETLGPGLLPFQARNLLQLLKILLHFLMLQTLDLSVYFSNRFFHPSHHRMPPIGQSLRGGL